MRSIRLMVALALVVAACSGGASDPVEVTGTEVCVSVASDGLAFTYECEDQTSDPRASGTATVIGVLEHSTPAPMSGTIELVNEGGTWVGDWTGEITGSGNHIIDAVLTGTGGYEGLEYDVHWEGVGDPWTVAGTIRDSK